MPRVHRVCNGGNWESMRNAIWALAAMPMCNNDCTRTGRTARPHGVVHASIQESMRIRQHDIIRLTLQGRHGGGGSTACNLRFGSGGACSPSTDTVFVEERSTGGIGKSWRAEKHFGVELWRSKYCTDGCLLGGQTHGRGTKAEARRTRVLAGEHVGAPVLAPSTCLAGEVVVVPKMFEWLFDGWSHYNAGTLNRGSSLLQVFFVEDKAMTGWSVVVKKEARGRRIDSTEEEHGLGQEASRDDLQVLSNMPSQERGPTDDVVGTEVDTRPRNRRRLNTHDGM